MDLRTMQSFMLEKLHFSERLFDSLNTVKIFECYQILLTASFMPLAGNETPLFQKEMQDRFHLLIFLIRILIKSQGEKESWLDHKIVWRFHWIIHHSSRKITDDMNWKLQQILHTVLLKWILQIPLLKLNRNNHLEQYGIWDLWQHVAVHLIFNIKAPDQDIFQMFLLVLFHYYFYFLVDAQHSLSMIRIFGSVRALFFLLSLLSSNPQICPCMLHLSSLHLSVLLKFRKSWNFYYKPQMQSLDQIQLASHKWVLNINKFTMCKSYLPKKKGISRLLIFYLVWGHR